MSCVNNHYSPEELESIFLWDFICEALPLTAEERREINGRNSIPEPGKRKHRAKETGLPKSADELKKEEERKRRDSEYRRQYRETHREQKRIADAAYRAKHREAINERQREYDRAKRASEKAKRVSA